MNVTKGKKCDCMAKSEQNISHLFFYIIRSFGPDDGNGH